MSTILFSALIVLLTASSASISRGLPDPANCRDAVELYKSATDEVSQALRPYLDCLTDSRGRSDCSVEFDELKSAQGNFESAVSEYQKQCYGTAYGAP